MSDDIERESFEAVCPVPDGVYWESWNENDGQYEAASQEHEEAADIQQARLQGWQAARAQGEGEAVVALARLESACESRAKSTTEDLYDQMTRIPGMVEALHELDNARRHARDLLADLDNMENGS